LHCLIVRGRGGVVARCWAEGTTKLNGEDFSVSWMVPGDRLGVGPIELELLEAGGEGPAATDNQQINLPSSPASCTDVVPQVNAEVARLTDELAKSQQFLEQLLEERQELLERLRSLELDLQQVVGERDHLRAIVDELRDEVAGMIRVRKQWEQEREELERQLDETRRGAGPIERRAEAFDEPGLEYEPSPADDFDGAPADSNDVSADDDDLPLDMKAMLARYGVVMKDEPDESEKGSDVGAASGSYGGTLKTSLQDGQVTVASSAPESATSGAAAQAGAAQVAKRRSPIPRINLSALRDVANLNARVDIDRAARSRGLKEAAFKWSMGLSAIAIGWFVTIILKQDMALARVLSGACWTIAVWWMFLGSLVYRRAVLVNPKRHQKKIAPKKNA
jgi:hypothetical protein